MMEQQQSYQDLQHIKKMMERSSRFISLSGLSGISAGICALIGAWVAHPYVVGRKNYIIDNGTAIEQARAGSYWIIINTWLFWIAIATFITALVTAFIFTYIKSRKEGIPIWGNAARRVMASMAIPLAVGGIFIFKLMQFGTFGLVAPGCLLFYGLGLINASKYTLSEIKYLGYGEILLGIISLNFVGYGIYFWAVGFGLLHIIYGTYMWVKYDKGENTRQLQDVE